jgi:hypothetical protein
MIRNHLIPAIACAAIILPNAASAQQHQCQPKAEHRLKEYNLEYSRMKEPQWVTNRFDRRGEDGVRNYTLYVQPPSCSKGDLVIVMSDDCYIQQAYTEHGCRVKGVSSY